MAVLGGGLFCDHAYGFRLLGHGDHRLGHHSLVALMRPGVVWLYRLDNAQTMLKSLDAHVQKLTLLADPPVVDTHDPLNLTHEALVEAIAIRQLMAEHIATITATQRLYRYTKEAPSENPEEA